MPAKRKPKSPAKKDGVANEAEAFEKLLRKASGHGQYVLRLYVTGNTVRSSHAIANVRSLCEEYLKERYELQVIDIYQQPGEAAKGQIIAAPTLIKELPSPVKRLIGDLSNRDKVMVGLDLEKAKGGEEKTSGTHWMKL